METQITNLPPYTITIDLDNCSSFVVIYQKQKMTIEEYIQMLVDKANEPKEISYIDCANAMLKMWMDNVLTDGEYYKIMDKLNNKYKKVNKYES